MTTLTTFLLDRIAEDEEDPWRGAEITGRDRVVGPDEARALREEEDAWEARVLAECEAKRRIVSRCDMVLRGREHGMFNGGQAVDANDNLRSLAQVYSDHPDYDPTWSA